MWRVKCRSSCYTGEVGLIPGTTTFTSDEKAPISVYVKLQIRYYIICCKNSYTLSNQDCLD